MGPYKKVRAGLQSPIGGDTVPIIPPPPSDEFKMDFGQGDDESIVIIRARQGRHWDYVATPIEAFNRQKDQILKDAEGWFKQEFKKLNQE